MGLSRVPVVDSGVVEDLTRRGGVWKVRPLVPRTGGPTCKEVGASSSRSKSPPR